MKNNCIALCRIKILNNSYLTRSSAVNLGSAETVIWIEAISTKVKTENLEQLTQFQPGIIHISAYVFICLNSPTRKSRKEFYSSVLTEGKYHFILLFWKG